MRLSLAFLVTLLVPTFLDAAPLPKDPPKGMPQFVVQFKSIDGLIGDYKFIKATIVKTEPATSTLFDFVEVQFTSLTNWRKAIDAEKPWGAYVALQPELDKNHPVLIVPVKNEKAFLDLVHSFNEGFKEDKLRGIYSGTISFGFVQQPGHFRFKDSYAYIAFEDASAIEDPKKLPAPADLLLKDETALVAIRLYLEAIPSELKKTARDFLDQLAKTGQVGGQEILLMSLIGAKDVPDFAARLKRLIDEAKWAALRLDFDQRTGELGLEFNLVPQRESELGKEIAAYKQRPSQFAGLFDKETAGGLLYSYGTFGGLKIPPEEIRDSIESFLRDTLDLDGGKDGTAALTKAFVEAVQVNEVDLALALKQKPGEKTYTLIAGARLNKADQFEKAILDFMKKIPEGKRGRFAPAALKVGDVAFHKFEIKGMGDEEKQLLGETDLWFSVKDDIFFFAVGKGAVERLKECLQLKPKEGPHLQIEMNPVLFKNLLPKDIVERWDKLYPKGERVRILSGEAEGGTTLRVRYKIDLIPVLKLSIDGFRFKLF